MVTIISQPPFLSSLKKPTTISSKSSFKIYSSSSNGESSPSTSTPEPDPIKLAFERAKAYKKSGQIDPLKLGYDEAKASENTVKINPDTSTDATRNSGSDSVKKAMERAKEYKKNGGVGSNSGKNALSGSSLEKKSASKKQKPTISSLDFIGLGFADKKEGRGLPAGLIPFSDPYPEGGSSEVEFIAGDPTRFGDSSTNTIRTEEENSEVYKPKVSTWGVFPRPSNISKTFGGGRVVRPGEVLETEEDKAARVERTRQLLAAYKKKMGLNIDPKLKFECEKALKEGDSLMDLGKLKQALPFYEEVMNKLPFQSELHGLAALQWSVCQDSLNRTNEARIMYEKLQSHPKVQVSKKARQFMFSFQAMEMMRVTSSSPSSKDISYEDYFEVFIKDKATLPVQDPNDEEAPLSKSFPYFLFLLSPIFVVLFIAVQKQL